MHVITSQDVSLPGPITDGTTTIQQPIYYYDYPYLVDISIELPDIELAVMDAETVEPEVLDAEVLDIRIASNSEFAAFRPIDDYEIQYQDIEVPVYESRESYIERMRADLDEFIDAALPHYLSQTAEGFAAEGLISEITAITKVDGSIYESLVSIVSIDTRDLQPGLVSSSSVFTDYTQGIYANAEHLYLFSPTYTDGSQQTNVLEFNWANGEREIELIGTGTIPGSLLNQFSADEFEGRLRVATTSSDYIDGVFTRTNQVCIYENIDGQLVPVGSTESFAENERIYSARFDGDRVFVVTFRQTDPLFVIDLSDPTAPTIEGELHVPGYSSYLHVIDRDHLLAVGRDTETFATKVSLYDISDPQNPTEIDNDVLPRWTWSQAEWDHHAVGYFAEHSTLAIPTSGYDFDSQTNRNQLLNFRIDVTQTGEDAITLRGSIDDDNTVSRGLYIDNVLYAVGFDSVIAAEIGNPKNILGRLDINSTAETLDFDDEPIFTESDDGAVDWEYLNLAESRADNELLAALGAINNLTGQVRVNLLDSAGSTEVTLADGQVTVVSEGLETQVIAIGEGTSLVVNGTDRRDVIDVDFSEPGEVALTSILVLGNEGNDVISVNGLDSDLAAITTFSGDAGNDRLTVGSTVTTGVRLSGGDGRDSLTGGVGRDWLHGGAGHDLLNGGRGSDQLFGAAGRDTLNGGTGNDLLSGGGANDTLNGGSGHDSLDGGAGNDLLRGGVGNDALRGGDGNDVLKGEDGNDILSGGAGNDRLMGGLGNDGLQGGIGDDYLAGEDGTDTLLGGDGNDLLRGGRGLDIVLGEAGDDDVNGEFGVGDTVSGGEGNDIVRGRSSEIDETFSITPLWLDRV